MANLLDLGRGKQPYNIRCGSDYELKEVHSAGARWAGEDAVVLITCGMVEKWPSTGYLARAADINLKLEDEQRSKDVD
jgi:hypothetical protein